MKMNPVSTLLVVLLSVSVLGSAGLSAWYVQLARQWGSWQSLAGVVNYRLSVAQSLINDATEYAKRNAKMEALLQAMNRKSQAGATTAPKPTGNKP